MAIRLGDEIVELLGNPDTIKILTTVDESGTPHAVAKQSLSVDSNGDIFYLERIESSRTNRNLVWSIWFERKVSILLISKDGRSYQIKGTPTRSHVSGPIFQKHYAALRARLGDVDLSAVWVITPESIIDESWKSRHEQEQTARPHFIHLDRIVNA
jgi:hypothetical protein